MIRSKDSFSTTATYTAKNQFLSWRSTTSYERIDPERTNMLSSSHILPEGKEQTASAQKSNQKHFILHNYENMELAN